jgi:hypothetical protein
MTWSTRIKLALGIAAMLLLVGVLGMRLDAEVRTVHAVEGQLAAQEYAVGTDYSGVLVDQYVSPGDVVRPGDPLFALKSSRLRRDLANGLIQAKDSTYRIRDGNTLVFIASAAGKVQSAGHLEGAFVPANTVIATIEVADSLHVRADFRLRPAEYALIREADRMTVTLPNGSTVPASITDVSVAADDNIAHTAVRADPEDLADEAIFGAGTPVTTSIELPGRGLVAGITDLVRGLLTPRGQS